MVIIAMLVVAAGAVFIGPAAAADPSPSAAVTPPRPPSAPSDLPSKAPPSATPPGSPDTSQPPSATPTAMTGTGGGTTPSPTGTLPESQNSVPSGMVPGIFLLIVIGAAVLALTAKRKGNR